MDPLRPAVGPSPRLLAGRSAAAPPATAAPSDGVHLSGATPAPGIPPGLSGASTGLSAAGAAVPGPSGLFAAAGLIVPEEGRSYSVETEWQGRPHRFEVQFGSLFSRWAQKKGVLIDLAEATALRPDGRRFHLFGAEVGAEYTQATGRPAHPWLQKDPILDYYGLPTQPVTVELTPEGVIQSGTERPFLPDFTYLRERPNLEGRPTPAELETLTDTKWLEEPRELPGDVLVYARTPELAAAAEERTQAILGHRGAAFGPFRQALQAEQDRLAALDPADTEAVKAALQAPAEWTAEDAAAALQARQAQIDHQLAPVRVFVMPDDKHWLSLPFLAGLKDSMLESPAAQGKATFLGTNLGLMVFVPEADLATGGYGLRHELYHALETKFLTDAERAELDALHDEAVRKGGPFESVYGHQRAEFLTTMAEEFEGEHGPDGPAWLREHHPRLHRLLTDVTGR